VSSNWKTSSKSSSEVDRDLMFKIRIPHDGIIFGLSHKGSEFSFSRSGVFPLEMAVMLDGLQVRFLEMIKNSF